MFTNEQHDIYLWVDDDRRVCVWKKKENDKFYMDEMMSFCLSLMCSTMFE